MCRDMKDSGVQWIGYIPKAWNITKIKMLSDIYTGTSISDDLKDRYTVKENAIPYISTKDLDISSKSIDYDNGLFIPNGEKGFRLAEKDSTLLCIEGGSAGKKVAFTDRDVNFVNKLCCIKSKDYNNKFIYYYINSSAFTEQFNLNLSGLIGGVSINLLKQIIIVVPTVYEQQKISNYLDKKVSQIDYIISKQKSLIEKYKAYKQSLITETVTKGLNKNVPMKDSGIAWIGEIPSHWSVCKMKNIGEAIIGLTYSPEEVSDKGTLVLRSSNVQNGKIVYEDNVFVNKDISEKLMTRIGDILICSRNGSRALIGKCAYIDELSAGKSFGAFMTIFRSKYNKFIYYTLNSAIFKFHIGTFLTSTINQLTTSNLSSIRITLPPKEEQQEISDFLDKECNSIDSVIAKKEKLIEKLEDYKKSLIYECVTGKRQVN